VKLLKKGRISAKILRKKVRKTLNALTAGNKGITRGIAILNQNKTEEPKQRQKF
jgi:hypothetical protein